MYYTHTPYNYITGATHLQIFRGRIAKMSLKNLQIVTASNERAVADYETDKARRPGNDEERERLGRDAVQRLAACNAETARRAK